MPRLTDDELDHRFRDIWLYCLTVHPGQGTLPGGPCEDCVARYAVTGPPTTAP
jgi:hypothetical protein